MKKVIGISKGRKFWYGLFLFIQIMVLGLIAAPSAHAIAIALDDPSTVGLDAVCLDGAGCDSNPVSGAVTFNNFIPGTSWIVNVTTGITYPTLGTPASAEIDLNSVNVSSSGGGILTILVSEKDYTGPIIGGMAPFSFGAGGFTAGTASFFSWLGDTNTLFGFTGLLGTLGPFGPGAFSGSIGGSASATAPFSLTVGAAITHSGTGVTSFDAHLVHLVPEPSTLLLLGSGLLGLGLWRTRKKSKMERR